MYIIYNKKGNFKKSLKNLLTSLYIGANIWLFRDERTKKKGAKGCLNDCPCYIYLYNYICIYI